MNYLIVGASSGLGRELCYTFAKNNNNLIICSRDLRDLTAIKSDIEKKFELIAIDSSGTNAFFINKVYLGDFEILDPIKSFKNSGACTHKEFIEINKVLLKRDGLVFLD